MVPTIDVDLFWHSHQLSPALYERFCFQTTSRYIDHNDKISTNVLDIAFEATCEHYWNGYQEDYGGCFCWACEVERDDDAKLEGKNWWQKRGEKRRVWERRVKVYFWREVEKQRLVGGTAGAFPGFAGLQSVLKMGPKQRRK